MISNNKAEICHYRLTEQQRKWIKEKAQQAKVKEPAFVRMLIDGAMEADRAQKTETMIQIITDEVIKRIQTERRTE